MGYLLLLAAFFGFAAGYAFCLSTWRRSARHDLANIRRLDDAFNEYKAISDRPKLVEVWGDWR